MTNLGWVELNLRSSLGRLANTVGSYCQGKMVEHPKSMLTKPGSPPDETPCKRLIAKMESVLQAS